MTRRRLALFVFACACSHAMPAAAVEFSTSAFATLGYAVSNEGFDYQRFIDDSGTFKRDSIVGAQVDAQLTNEIAATLQVKTAADDGSDRRYKTTASWGFLSWRPNNDWLVRVGKQRIPLYLFSENLDVGATYDFLRLPTEMYSIVPSNDAIMASLGRSWRLGDGELNVGAYGGKTRNDIREWVRQGIPGALDAGVHFEKLDFLAGGLLVEYRSEQQTFRLAAVRSRIRPSDKSPFMDHYPFVTIAPGIGYYDVVGPAAVSERSVRSTLVALGADVALPAGARVVGEFARTVTTGSNVGPMGNRGYLALLERVGKFTPYVDYAFLRSPQSQRDFFARLDGNTVPAFIPGAALIDATQTLGADNVFVYHQSSWTFGSSYSFSAKSKLKAEFLRTHVYDVSKLVDSPVGTNVHDRGINVFSLSYSVVY